jgi:hypothetical protein
VAVDLKRPRQDEPRGGVLEDWGFDLEELGGTVGDRVEPQLASEEVACLVGQGSWLVGAVEVQLQRVDGFQTQLGGPDGGQPVGACGLVELVEQRGVGRLELDGVAVGFEPGRVAGLGAADQGGRSRGSG